MDTTVEHPDVSRYTIPLSESKAKAWIDSLSVTDFGETTKRVYHGLADLNRRALSPVVRIRIGERLRPKFDVLAANLQRHLVYRAFPLPERGQRIFDLSQSLLLEFAGLYQLAALDMLTRDEVNKRALQVAIYRVIDYLGQYLLSTYAVYIRTRETIWHDIHHMYLLASEYGLDRLKMGEGRTGAGSIEARYVQVNLLVLFKPYSLRQEEIQRIARYIETVTHLVQVSNEPLAEERTGDFVHASMLNNDEPAVIMPYRDLPHSPTVRVFNLRALIMDIDAQIHSIGADEFSGLVTRHGLSRHLLKRMVFHLTTVRNRNSNRFAKQEKVTLVLGMEGILDAMTRNSRDQAKDKQEEDLLFNNLVYGESNLLSAEDKKAGPVEEPGRDIHIWDVINSSVGGYGLHWPHKETSAARVGELVGLRDMSKDSNPLMVGVIKWMECVNKQGLNCGIELLSTKIMTVSVLTVRNRRTTHRLPLEGLMLPSVEGIRPDPVLILPAYIFQPGDEVNLRFQKREEVVALTALDECLGSFAHFRFRNCTETEQKVSGDDFNNLWGAL
ncbi:MAG: hypothetical protein R3E95_01010 [Thiolinea sp.]